MFVTFVSKSDHIGDHNKWDGCVVSLNQWSDNITVLKAGWHTYNNVIVLFCPFIPSYLHQLTSKTTSR